MKKVLTIAGSDSSGGAGIQADIKTITVHKMYAMSAVTALTAQNTLGVTDIENASPKFVANELDAIFTDIFPDSVKIGMVSEKEIIEIIAEKLTFYKAKNIVVDPVMVSTSGSKLLSDDAILSLTSLIFPLASVITPNIPEAIVLSGIQIKDKKDMIKAGRLLYKKYNCPVLIKGGHLVSDATDLLCTENKEEWFSTKRVDTNNTHGTGCTLSSAIACNLANNLSLSDSIKKAKEYLLGALEDKLNLGQGSGPLNHTYLL